MMERQSVEIDYCPQCRGVWLDRGELDKIIEKSAAEMAPRGEAPYRPQAPGQPGAVFGRERNHDDEHGRSRDEDHRGSQGRRRGSFLEGLFGGGED